MSDLYYQVSYGSGSSAVDGAIRRVESNENEFTVFVFGNSINPKDSKSKLFRCRNLISCITGHFVGKNRGHLEEGFLDKACDIVDSTLIYGNPKDLVVLRSLDVEEYISDKELYDLYANLYSILWDISERKYGVSGDIAICWYLDEIEYKKLKEREQQWGSAIHYVDDYSCVLFFL